MLQDTPGVMDSRQVPCNRAFPHKGRDSRAGQPTAAGWARTFPRRLGYDCFWRSVPRLFDPLDSFSGASLDHITSSGEVKGCVAAIIDPNGSLIVLTSHIYFLLATVASVGPQYTSSKVSTLVSILSRL